MSRPKFTPGPWHYQEHSDAYTHIVRCAENNFIASTPQWSDGTAEADARLIAAAPDMYAALEAVLARPCACYSVADENYHSDKCPYPAVIEALRKAGRK